MPKRRMAEFFGIYRKDRGDLFEPQFTRPYVRVHHRPVTDMIMPGCRAIDPRVERQFTVEPG